MHRVMLFTRLLIQYASCHVVNMITDTVCIILTLLTGFLIQYVSFHVVNMITDTVCIVSCC